MISHAGFREELYNPQAIEMRIYSLPQTCREKIWLTFLDADAFSISIYIVKYQIVIFFLFFIFFS